MAETTGLSAQHTAALGVSAGTVAHIAGARTADRGAHNASDINTTGTADQTLPEQVINSPFVPGTLAIQRTCYAQPSAQNNRELTSLMCIQKQRASSRNAVLIYAKPAETLSVA